MIRTIYFETYPVGTLNDRFHFPSDFSNVIAGAVPGMIKGVCGAAKVIYAHIQHPSENREDLASVSDRIEYNIARQFDAIARVLSTSYIYI